MEKSVSFISVLLDMVITILLQLVAPFGLVINVTRERVSSLRRIGLAKNSGLLEARKRLQEPKEE
jgi:hypothetical protein